MRFSAKLKAELQQVPQSIPECIYRGAKTGC